MPIRTIKIKIDHANERKLAKLESVKNSILEMAKEYMDLRKEQIETPKFNKSKEFYHYARKKWPDVNSSVVQTVGEHCESLIKAWKTWCRKKKKLVKFPDSPDIPIILKRVKIELTKTSTKYLYWLKLWRTAFPLKVSDYHQEIISSASKFLGSKIVREQNGRLVFHLTCEIPPKILDASLPQKAIGIDIGIEKPIVCSDGKQFGNGQYIRHKKLEFRKKRIRHQKKNEEISRKQSRWMTDTNHKLSRQLIDYCLSQGVNVLVLEKVRGSHLANKKWRKYTWAFADMLGKIRHKAELSGIKVISVNPAYTSQRCYSCGKKCKNNRHQQSLYECSCGYRANADVNAAKNILSLSAEHEPTVSMAMSKALNSEVAHL